MKLQRFITMHTIRTINDGCVAVAIDGKPLVLDDLQQAQCLWYVPPLGTGPHGVGINVNIGFEIRFLVALVQYSQSLSPLSHRGAGANDSIVGNLVGRNWQ